MREIIEKALTGLLPPPSRVSVGCEGEYDVFCWGDSESQRLEVVRVTACNPGVSVRLSVKISDLIVGLAGQRVRNCGDLGVILDRHRAGDNVILRVLRKVPEAGFECLDLDIQLKLDVRSRDQSP